MIRVLDRVITSREALLSLRRDGGSGRIVLFVEELDEDVRERFEARLNGLRGETGTAVGKMAAVAVGMVFLVFLVVGGSGFFRGVGEAAMIGTMHVGLAAIWGKILGVRSADRQFRETAVELAGILAGGLPKRMDAFTALVAERSGKQQAFRLREQQA